MKTIAVIAPSSRGEINPADISVLEARGYTVRVHPQCALTHNQSAGTPAQRAQAIMDVFCDPSVDIVLSARGGNRAMHVLPLLDFDTLKKHPKPFIGFSDGTALLNAFYAQAGLEGLHGPTLSRMARGADAEIDQLVTCLQGKPSVVDLSTATTLKAGHAAGPMIGGNLSVFTALVGTPYMPDPTGKILYLEDIGDQLSRYDRMLAQLRLAGILDKVAGLVFGVMHAEGDSSVTPFGFTLDDILCEHTAHLNVPVMCDAPFGHKGPLYTMPVGGRARLDTSAQTLAIE